MFKDHSLDAVIFIIFLLLIYITQGEYKVCKRLNKNTENIQ